MSIDPPHQEPAPNDPEPYSRRLRRILVASAVALVVAVAATLALGPLSGGSSSSNSSATAVGSPSSGLATTGNSSAPSEGCTSGVAGADVRVTIYGNGEAACSEWNEGAAKSSGEYWKTEPGDEELHGELVCSMSKGGALVVEVRDAGEHLRGNQICASLTAKGWREAEGPGAKVEREQAQRKAEREQAATAERTAQNERVAQKRQREQAQLEKEEAANRRQEAQEHQKEDREHEQEAQKQHEELEKQNKKSRAKIATMKKKRAVLNGKRSTANDSSAGPGRAPGVSRPAARRH